MKSGLHHENDLEVQHGRCTLPLVKNSSFPVDPPRSPESKAVSPSGWWAGRVHSLAPVPPAGFSRAGFVPSELSRVASGAKYKSVHKNYCTHLYRVKCHHKKSPKSSQKAPEKLPKSVSSNPREELRSWIFLELDLNTAKFLK